MVSQVTSTIQMCKDVRSIVSQTKNTLYGNLKQQCGSLCHELRLVEQMHTDLQNKINGNTGPWNSEQGLQDAIQDVQKVVNELFTAVSGDPLKKLQILERYKLRQLISEKTQSLKEAREMVTYALLCSSYRPYNPHSSGTVTDESEGHETTDNEPPTIKEISGIIQPHDVTTFKNQIIILMNGGIIAYNMVGQRIKRYQEDGFKPFAATFLGTFFYVTDKKRKCVIKFDESFNVKKMFGTPHMIEPAGITSCERGNCIYVLTGRDVDSAEVAQFNADGKYIGCHCSGSLEDPWFIKKSSSDKFFISDFAKKAVLVFSHDLRDLLCTIKTYNPVRGMDIDDEGNIYIAQKNPECNAQQVCIYTMKHENKWELLKESQNQLYKPNKSLNFAHGLHHYRCQDKTVLMVVDAGNKRIKVIPL